MAFTTPIIQEFLSASQPSAAMQLTSSSGIPKVTGKEILAPFEPAKFQWQVTTLFWGDTDQSGPILE
jgi:hypothetical protein